MGLLAAVGLLAAAADARAQERRRSQPPPIPPDAAAAHRLLRLPPGLQATLFAVEPQIANPVALTIDRRGRVYVAVTERYGDGVFDIRQRTSWPGAAFRAGATPERLAGLADEILDWELAARTVDDRERFLKTYLAGEEAALTRYAERVVVLTDRDGDGRAESARTFAEGFNHALDGTAAGLLAGPGGLWFACIPNLWWLGDSDRDGISDQRTVLQRGYGVRYGFRGHDLHGLRMGPDGRIYFSIGDRGVHVKQGDRVIEVPETGAVLRSNPDGSDLEVFATGLRNPQSLAFDEWGNLFSGDNNSDGGDRARFVHVVEGGDSGWRLGYQFIEEPVARGPWNAEGLWHARTPEQTAHIVPPVAVVSTGPAGLTYNPGTALDPASRGLFLLADFRGQPSVSGLLGLRVAADGAGFRLVSAEPYVWNVVVSDADFGPDGALYVLDWTATGEKTGKGRIWRVTAPAHQKDPDRESAQRILGEDFTRKKNDDLLEWLAHHDQRVRQDAQFQLVENNACDELAYAAEKNPNRHARLHALWGLGQILRRPAAAANQVRPVPGMGRCADRASLGAAVVRLLADPDDEVRALAARMLSDARWAAAARPLTVALRDASPRVRFFAAVGLGRLRARDAVPALVAMLADNADRDAYLRHAGVMGLAGAAEPPRLAALAEHPSRSVRLAALLALRRLGRPEVARFLADRDPLIVRDAARAINDERIDAALPALAALTTSPARDPSAPTLLRAIHAAYRQGTPAAAAALARLAGRADAGPDVRAAAIAALADWAVPGRRDRVTGLARPLPPMRGRTVDVAARALSPVLPALLRDGPDPVRVEAVRAAEALRLAATPALAALFGAESPAGPEPRAAALATLVKASPAELPSILDRARGDPWPHVRVQALATLAARDPATAAAAARQALRQGTLIEQQKAYALLAGVADPEIDRLLLAALDELDDGRLPDALALDVLEAADRREDPGLRARLAARQARQTQDDLAPFRETLAGGDAATGRRLFMHRPELQCRKCHPTDGESPGAGPNLRGVGARLSREALLESVVLPNKTFSPGFDAVVLTLKDGSTVAGVVKERDGDDLRLLAPDDKWIAVKTADVRATERGVSAMPEGFGQILNRRELRDLVEYLASLK